MSGVFYHSVIHGLGFLIYFMIQILRAQNNKTRFFYVLYSDKTRVCDQSERAQGPIHVIKRSIDTLDVNGISRFFGLLNVPIFLCVEKIFLKPRPNDRNIQHNIRPNIVVSCCDLLRRAGQTHATSRNNLRNFSEYLWPPVSCRLGRKHGVCS